VAGEIAVGATIGFIAQLALSAVEIAGELIAHGMGLSIAAVFDPARGEQQTVVASFLNTLALLMFLAMNGHHVLIRAAAVSFERIPLGGMIAPAAAGGVASLGGRLVQSGFALAAPLVALLLVVNVILALVGKAAPQANVFLLGLPLSLGLGLLGLVDVLPGFGQSVGRLMTEMSGQLDLLVLGATHGVR
jgi:flagellar biosynthesis protein FliR